MSDFFEFISPTDKPALLALSSPPLHNHVQAVLQQLEYKTHSALSHDNFLSRFAQIQYQLVVLEELFASAGLDQNISLLQLQLLPMSQRRHAVILLIGSSFKSLDPLQAFQQSVHAVVHPDDLDSLGPIIIKAVSENDLFLNPFRDTQLRLAQAIER